MATLTHPIPSGFEEDEAKTFVVSKKTKRLWSVLLDLLAEFDRVCKANDVQYFADAGTILGAARHKGMIPWDDDIDVIMFRDQYEKLCQIAPTAFTHPYFFQTNDSDPGSCRGHAQLRNSTTTGILKCEMSDGKPLYRFNQGIFMDVFVMDNVPDDDVELQDFCNEISRRKSKLWYLRYAMATYSKWSWVCLCSPLRLLRYLKMTFFRIKSVVLGKDIITLMNDDIEKFAQKYNRTRTARCAPVSFRPRRKPGEFFRRCLFDDVVRMPFEFLEVPVPAGWRELLEGRYGDWNRHVVGASTHGGMLLDVDRPYTEYLKK